MIDTPSFPMYVQNRVFNAAWIVNSVLISIAWSCFIQMCHGESWYYILLEINDLN